MSSAKDRILAGANRARASAPPAQLSDAASVDPEPTPERNEQTPEPVRKPKSATPNKGTIHAVPVIAPRQKDIRKNVDLSPDQNDRLGDWQRAAARELGVARVTAQDVLVALVERLLADPDLGQQIKRDLHTGRP